MPRMAPEEGSGCCFEGGGQRGLFGRGREEKRACASRGGQRDGGPSRDEFYIRTVRHGDVVVRVAVDLVEAGCGGVWGRVGGVCVERERGKGAGGEPRTSAHAQGVAPPPRPHLTLKIGLGHGADGRKHGQHVEKPCNAWREMCVCVCERERERRDLVGCSGVGVSRAATAAVDASRSPLLKSPSCSLRTTVAGASSAISARASAWA